MLFNAESGAVEDATPSISTAWGGSRQESLAVDRIPQSSNGSWRATKPIILIFNKWDLIPFQKTKVEI